MKELKELNGIGSKRIELFNKIGIFTIDDLIYYYPKRYDFLVRTNMRKALDNDKVTIDGIVEMKPCLRQTSSRVKQILFRINDGCNLYHVCVFNQDYLCKQLNVGSEVIVIGKYEKSKNTIVASEIRLGKLSNEMKVEPFYSTTEGLTRKIISKTIEEVLNEDIQLKDYIPECFVNKYHFPSKFWSVSQIHFPSDGLSYRKAKQRLKYEEFFWYLVRINYLKFNLKNEEKSIKREFDVLKLNAFIDNLPFSLTSDQLKVIEEIKEDLISNKRMNRLVQGDVGSGKTIVAFLAAYINFLSGYQTALMVPTEILANQHFLSAISLLEGTGMKIVLLTSSISVSKRKNILNLIRSGEVDFIIGTQSLIQEQVVYSNLGLIITDEQHRFGVNQRNDLKNKGLYPDVLSMSATPIPRTYALTIYGDMDVSNIKTKPAGRKEVITFSKSYDDITEVLMMMKKELEVGHQIYVIAPSIENEDEFELDNVLLLQKKMNLAFGKKWKVGIVHGKLEVEKKNQVMKDFENNDIQILISTTVIEVGVNVPNASMIVVFQANLFGLSTLHQLRGRVGRGDIQSYCILISKEECERLQLLEQTSDGFKISEYDFKNRGEGDLFGVRQSGNVEFKLADVKRDFELLYRVKKDVDEFIKNYLFDNSYKDYLELFKKM